MDPTNILATATIFLAILFALILWGSRRRPPMDRPEARFVWEAVAKRLGGKLFVQDGDYRVRFSWQGREAALHERKPIVVEITGGGFGKLDLEMKTGHMGHLGGEGPPAAKQLARPLIARGDRRIADEFLGPSVLRLLGDLANLYGATVVIGARFRVSGNPERNADSLTRFTLLSLQLAQHARLFAEKSSEISVVDTTAPSGGECQICGAELEGALVRCSRCSTPHHADCWEYTGACSTYGCGEKTFVN
ncbi:MAG TPA: RING finger protein [Planctomycetota bacterium]|jgi:hypothetical protein|nr:RING finger protein [Planctomycetota bacterium]